MGTVHDDHPGDQGSGSVVSLVLRREADQELRAQREIRDLALVARQAIDDLLAGDIDAAFEADWRTTQVTRIVMHYRMASGWTKWRVRA